MQRAAEMQPPTPPNCVGGGSLQIKEGTGCFDPVPPDYKMGSSRTPRIESSPSVDYATRMNMAGNAILPSPGSARSILLPSPGFAGTTTIGNLLPPVHTKTGSHTLPPGNRVTFISGCSRTIANNPKDVHKTGYTPVSARLIGCGKGVTRTPELVPLTIAHVVPTFTWLTLRAARARCVSQSMAKSIDLALGWGAKLA